MLLWPFTFHYIKFSGAILYYVLIARLLHVNCTYYQAAHNICLYESTLQYYIAGRVWEKILPAINSSIPWLF